MNARELMTPNPHVVTGDQPVSHAAQVMRDFNVGLLPVVDDPAYLRPRGVITDRDIVVRCIAGWQPGYRKIEDFMSSEPLVAVAPDADVEEIMEVMERNQVRRVLVVENGCIIGIIAQADLALKEGPLDPLKVEEVLERISAPAPVGV